MRGRFKSSSGIIAIIYVDTENSFAEKVRYSFKVKLSVAEKYLSKYI